MENFYTTLEDAKLEIQERWQNDDLKNKVREYLEGDIPEVFLNEPRAVLARNITSPDNEFLYFLRLADDIGLRPLSIEYLRDKFFTMNTDKMAYADLKFLDDKKNIHKLPIINFGENDKKSFLEIRTKQGGHLIDFHHDLLDWRLKTLYGESNVYDMSDWYSRNGGNASSYYKYYLSIFTCFGALFENFVTDDSESEFEEKVVLPAFQEVQDYFGVRPLIVPLAPDPDDVFWWCYPSEVEEYINKNYDF